jgi:hypothetical protein
VCGALVSGSRAYREAAASILAWSSRQCILQELATGLAGSWTAARRTITRLLPGTMMWTSRRSRCQNPAQRAPYDAISV